MSFVFVPVGGMTDPSGNFVSISTYQGQPATSGTNKLVAGQAGKSIYVISYALQATGTVTAQLKDSGGNGLSPAWTFQAREGISRPSIPGGYLFMTAVSTDLNLNLGGAVGVNVEIQYVIF